MNPKVDEFLNKATKWREEFGKLRMIILNFQLTEELKWGVPCYTFQERNVVLIHGFKEYCALLFFKGALLKDTHGILISQTEKVQASGCCGHEEKYSYELPRYADNASE